MSANNSRHLTLFEQPPPESVAETVYEFLQSLPGPSVFKFAGKETGCRVITTLLHANEPSGIRVLHRLLKEGFTPVKDTYFVVASVAAAKLEPTFSHRILPGERDLNRCFSPPYTDLNGQLAKAIIDFLVSKRPELVIDLHNTSGSGPIFSVSTRHQGQHIALGSFFSRWLVHTDIQLGALMELPLTCPIITVEAGGAQDKEADINAYTGITRLLKNTEPFEVQQPVDLMHKPIRLEVEDDSSLAYSDKPVFGANITLCQDIERFNFGITTPQHTLGWADFDGLEHLRLNGEKSGECICDFFRCESGELRTVQPLKVFMATSQQNIAKSDCILYFVAQDSQFTYPISNRLEEDANILSRPEKV